MNLKANMKMETLTNGVCIYGHFEHLKGHCAKIEHSVQQPGGFPCVFCVKQRTSGEKKRQRVHTTKKQPESEMRAVHKLATADSNFKQHERYLFSITRVVKYVQFHQNTMFKWNDIRVVRPHESVGASHTQHSIIEVVFLKKAIQCLGTQKNLI